MLHGGAHGLLEQRQVESALEEAGTLKPAPKMVVFAAFQFAPVASKDIDEAYVRGVLGEMASARKILVINDEAHHAWRVPAGVKVAGVSRADVEEATKWIGGLDRIHRARGILACHDFTATPIRTSRTT